MKKEIIKIILVASLAFNLAFIGAGIFRVTKNDKTVIQQESSFAGQYKLSDDQKEKIDEIVQNFRVKLADNKSDVLEKRIDIVELLGGPVGLNTISTAVGEESGTIEEVYEPFLIKEGYLKRTPRGREATEHAYKHLGKQFGHDQPGTLF